MVRVSYGHKNSIGISIKFTGKWHSLWILFTKHTLINTIILRISPMFFQQVLKHEREWALTTLAGKLFQSFITRFENELSLTFVLALGLQSFKLWPLGGKLKKSRCIKIQHTIGVNCILVSHHLIFFYNTNMVSEGKLIIPSMADLSRKVLIV